MASRRVTIEFLGDDKTASKTARNVDSSVSKMGDTFKRVGKTAAIGLGIGIAAAGTALVAFGKSAAAEAEEARKVAAQTEAVIKSTGGAANVTAGQVADLAEKLSLKAGVDDELIQSGSNVLLTFKNIRNEVGKGNDIFNQATGIALDMSTALGTDMKSASILVGKALNDPVAGLSALSRVGVSFTEKQKKVIERLVESGDSMKAQKLILKELNSEFAGSAAAQATAGDKARVAWGNFQEQIGAKLLPLLDKLAIWFVVVVIPALQKFAGWVQREGIPAVREFAASFREKLQPVIDWVREHWPEISRIIRQHLTTLVEIVRTVVDVVRKIWNKWGDDIFRVVKVIFESIVAQIRAGLKVVRGVINVVTGLIKGDWDQAWTGVKQIFGGIWDLIKNIVKTALKLVREQIRTAWDAVKDIFKRAWDGIRDLVASALSKLRDKIRDLLEAIKDRIVAVWDAIRDRVADVVGGIRDRVVDVFDGMRDRLASTWDAVRDKIGNVWDGIRTIFDRLKDGVRLIPEAFRRAKEGIGRVWEGLKRVAAIPVNFVINKVYNDGIRKAMNLIPTVDLGEADLIKFKSGGWTGPGPTDRPAGVVDADEFVIQKKARLVLENLRPGALDYMNRTGMWPRYLSGGRVWPYPDPTPTTYYNHDGVDLQGPMGAPFYAADAGRISYVGWGRGYGHAIFERGPYGELVYGHSSNPLVSAGQNVAAGQVIGLIGSTGNSSGPHVHFGFPGGTYEQAIAFLGGASVVGGSAVGAGIPSTGLFDNFVSAATAIPDFIGAIDDVWDDVNSMFDRSGFWDLFGKGPKHFLPGITDWGVDKIKDAGGWLKDEAFRYTPIGAAYDQAKDAWDAVSGIDVPGFGNGGIVTRPTLAMVGEKGPEAIVPLRRGHSGGGDIHVHVHGPYGVSSGDAIAKDVQQMLVRLKRRNGGIALGLS